MKECITSDVTNTKERVRIGLDIATAKMGKSRCRNEAIAVITDKFIESIEKVFYVCGTDTTFGQVNVQEWLKCSKSKSTNVMKAMKTAKIIKKVSGSGFGKYQFIEL